MTRVDIVVAVRNEEESIPVFLGMITALRLPDEVELKVVFVEDSSTDGTRPLLRRLARENPRVGYYTLAQCFGQGGAVTFGLSRSTADAMIMMDSDGSHPVAVIPEMVDGFLGGAQVVQCVRRTLANRPSYRRLGASAYHLLARLLTGVDPTEQNIFYRLISAGVARDVLQRPRYWHYLRFPLPVTAGALRKIWVDTEERMLGQSKYNFRRLVNLGIDGALSQISLGRFVAELSLLGLVALLTLFTLLWPLGVLLALAMIWVVYRYRRLNQPDLLQRMQVLECGNVPGMT